MKWYLLVHSAHRLKYVYYQQFSAASPCLTCINNVSLVHCKAFKMSLSVNAVLP